MSSGTLRSFAAVRCLFSMGKTATQWAVREVDVDHHLERTLVFRALELTYA